ncbi:MAG: autotransporter-associated beta strand repeat-containing protein [Opitutaceae bacterium]|jgi:fibronectin-binding autotransporter adhesin
MPRTVSRLATACVLLLIVNSAQASAYNWTASSDTTWATGWTGGNVPTTGDDLTVLGPLNAAGALNIDVAATAAAKTVNFTDTSAVTLTNINSGADQTLTLQSGLTTGTGAVTIGSTTANQGVLVAVGSAQTWNIGAGGLTLNNSYSGTGTLTKTGTGTLTLNGANVSTGNLTINGGTVVANGDTVAVLSAGKPLGFGGGAFSYRSTNASANTQTLGGISVSAGSNTITSEESGSGSSTLTIGTISRTAGATINLVTVGAGAAIKSTSAMSLNRGVFYNGDYATATAGGAVGAVVYGTTSGTANASGAMGTVTNGNFYNITADASVIGQNFGAGTVRFGGNFTFSATGTATSIGGFLTNGATAAVINGGGALRQNGEMVFATNGGSDQLTVGNAITTFNAGVITSVTKTGAGKLILNANNTYNGNTAVDQGTLQTTTDKGLGFGAAMSAINLGNSNTTVAAGATLDLAPASSMTVNEAIILNGGALANSGSGTTTINNGIAAVNLTNLGSGTATSGSVSFGGTGSGAIGTVTITGGAISSFTLTNAGSGFTGATTVNLTTTGSTGAAATAILSSLTLNGTANTIGGAGNLVINAIVADGASSGGFTKTGAGTVTLNGANTYTGNTAISAGTLTLGAADRIADTSNLVMSGGTLATGGFSETLGTLTLSANSTIDLGAGTSALVFSDSSGTTWGSSITLSFVNFTAGTDTIRIGTTSGGLTGAQLAEITINGSAATIDSGGFLAIAIPEPSTYAAILGIAVLGFVAFRRRSLRC